MTRNIPTVIAIRVGSPIGEESFATRFRKIIPPKTPVMLIERKEVLNQCGQGRIHSGDLVSTLANMIQNHAGHRTPPDHVFLIGMPHDDNEASILTKRFDRSRVHLFAANAPTDTYSDNSYLEAIERFRKKSKATLHTVGATSETELLSLILDQSPLNFEVRRELKGAIFTGGRPVSAMKASALKRQPIIDVPPVFGEQGGFSSQPGMNALPAGA